LDLALGAVAKRGHIIAVEDPTYVGIHDLLRGRGLRALPLPLDLIDDPSDQLSKLLIAGHARAVLLIPAVHSPTGRVRRRTHLEALARQLDIARLPAIEDNTLADLAFTGRRPPSLASLCRRAPVISIESTSKVGWGGLRVGWIRAAPDLIDATVTERGRTDYGTSVPSQLVALQLLSTYDQVIRRRRQALKQSAATFARLVNKHLPDWTWQPPDGGLSAWIDTHVDTDLLLDHALRHRVAFATGPSASRSPSARTHLRACFDRPAVELEAAIIRLARAANDTRGHRSARQPPNRGHALP
jgi:DNA-binding transcriptional MocR family regulator